MPQQMTVQYIRSYKRIEPSKDHPINTRLSINRLSLKFMVLDISTGGMALKVPNVELLLDIGDVLDNIEILLTERDKITVTGQVRFIQDAKCCIKFIDISPRAEGILAQYMERRKLVDIVREKLFMDVEEEVMKFEGQ